MQSITLSNQIEELLERLLAAFAIPSAKRLILVEDLFLKSWLQLELCRRHPTHTFFGIEILSVTQGIEKLLFFKRYRECLESFASPLDIAVSSSVHTRDKDPLFCGQVTALATLQSRFSIGRPQTDEQEQAVQVVLQDKRLRHLSQEPQGAWSACPYTEVHLFGISSLCPLYHRLFIELGKHVPISLYALSPCMMFWSDMYTERQQARIQERTLSKKEALFLDDFPLLANCGIVARGFSKLLEDAACDITEAYRIPEWADEARPDAIAAAFSCKKTLLKQLQADLLLINEDRASYAADGTVQIHSAPTHIREVELLYERLVKEPLEPVSVIIYAPSIETYRPYIERVFPRHLVTFVSNATCEHDGIIEAFCKILRILDSRWSADDVLSLFSCRAILKKLGVKKEDVAILRTCMERLGVFWGLDERHKKEVLKKEEVGTSGTFSEFYETFLDLWITNRAPQRVTLTVSESEAMARFMHFIFSLRLDTTAKTLSEWSLFLEMLLADSFFIDEEEQTEQLRLSCAIQRLKKSIHAYGNEILPLSRLIDLVEISLSDEHVSIPKTPFVCTSLGNLRAYPARAIVFLGMNEENFPRKSKDWTLRYGAESSYAFDKHLFLEALLSARSWIYISFKSFCFKEQSALLPSGCIFDLMHSYPLSIHAHSIDSFEKVADNAPKKKPFFQELVSKKEVPTTTCSIDFLVLAARSPLQIYFQERGIHFYDAPHKVLDDEFAAIAPKVFRSIKKEALFLQRDARKQLVEDRFAALTKPLQHACVELVEEEVVPLQEKLQKLGIRPSSFYSITFSMACKAPLRLENGAYMLPAVSLGSFPPITGTIDFVHESGMLIFGKKELEETMRNWPRLLLIAYANRYFGLQAEPAHIFLEQGEKKSYSFPEIESTLLEYMVYVHQCKDQPLGLYPEWMKALLYEETMPTDISESDPYLAFFLSKAVEPAWREWKSIAKKLYGAWLIEGEQHEL